MPSKKESVLDLLNAVAVGIKSVPKVAREMAAAQKQQDGLQESIARPIQTIFIPDGPQNKIDLIRTPEGEVNNRDRAALLRSSDLASVFGELPPITLEAQPDELLIQINYENVPPTESKIELSLRDALNLDTQVIRPPLHTNNDIVYTSIPLNRDSHRRDELTMTAKGVPIASISYDLIQFNASHPPQPVVQIVIAPQLFTPQEMAASQT